MRAVAITRQWRDGTGGPGCRTSACQNRQSSDWDNGLLQAEDPALCHILSEIAKIARARTRRVKKARARSGFQHIYSMLSPCHKLAHSHLRSSQHQSSLNFHSITQRQVLRCRSTAPGAAGAPQNMHNSLQQLINSISRPQTSIRPALGITSYFLHPAVTQEDRHYIRQALEQAKRALGKTYPNPAVGCVIVKDGQVSVLQCDSTVSNIQLIK